MGSDGLSGCDKLNKTDHIIIFFTKNAKKIDMSEIANHGDAELDMIEVPAGKQSADIHIGSYLGYIAGSNKGKDCSIVIISKDTDFDNVIKFWKAKTGVKSSRAQQIKVSVSKAMTAKQEVTSKKATLKVSGEKKTKLNSEVMQAARAAGFDAVVANSVVQLVTGLYGKDRLMNEVHNALRKKYTNYLEVYEAIKPVLSKYADTPTAPTKASGTDKTAINNEIMQILRKADFEQEIIKYVVPVVVKNVQVKNGKQQIYRTIISKYGQSKGLNIYNHIKKHI
ncbi:MAG: hypothetical protein HDR00_10100 [Lachnospiraceae bacterium]|nr:hypothetical protein [Lachnospiraceae bacterium]